MHASLSAISSASTLLPIPTILVTLVSLSTSIPKASQFKYVKNPAHSICNTSSVSNNTMDGVDLLIYIHSAPSNFKNRIIIRETWGKRALFPQIRLVFMLGSTRDQEVSDKVNMESEIYHDIVQQNFDDSYRNLTLKCLMALDWVTKYCSQSKFVLKTDDDVIVNTFFVLQTIERKLRHNTAHAKELTCLGWKAARVNRNQTSKWYVSYEEYPDEKFPVYCSGFFLLFSGASLEALYRQALIEKFFWIDDIWLTGIVARKANVKIYMRKNWIFQHSVEKKFTSGRRGLEILSGHLNNNVGKIIEIWNHLIRLYVQDPKLIRINVNKFGWAEFNSISKEMFYFEN